jgi:hypothetical protein
MRATALYQEALLLSRAIGIKVMMADGLEGLAWSVVAQGQPEWAARLGGAAEALRKTLSVPLSLERRAGHDQAVAAMRAALDEEAFAAAWAAGRSMPLEAAIAYALE